MRRRAVEAQSLGKTYRIRHPHAPTWRQYLTGPAAARRRPRSLEVAALRDVSFGVDEGEVFGIIGRNGAGKSTLLKILSRVTTPTTGRAAITGRVASLLEVGTGFHPELTGRENIFLNGMLLGMQRRDVVAQFDRICDFAGIGDYIDTPIKRYSSGMQLRLAFAVAAHLAADTMIIDEVLAVGDAEFQRKCMGAMRDVQARGRTTLFVSHNMAAVESLCTRVMWLDSGAVRAVGAPERVIRDYLAAGLSETAAAGTAVDLGSMPRGWVIGGARLTRLGFGRRDDALGRPPWHVAFGESFSLAVEFDLERPDPDAVVGIGIRNERGEDILTSHSADGGHGSRPLGAGPHRASVAVAEPWLRPGTYYLEVAVISGMQLLDHVRDAAVLVVAEQSAAGAPPLALKKGYVSPLWSWRVE